MRVVGFVPARGGSERTPNKNLSNVLGLPLFLWAANNLNRVLPKEDIYIDSDSDQILSIAKNYGFQTIRRPDNLATNATDGNKFMLWEVSNVEADIYVQHLPPMPFLREATLRDGLDAVMNKGYDSAVGVVSDYLYLWENGQPTYNKKSIPNSFTLTPTVVEGMGIYITSRDSILQNETRFGDRPFLLELDRYESLDIDYPGDLDFVKVLSRGLDKNSVYLDGIKELRKLEHIKLLVLDVDGTMTDGGMYVSELGDELKKFNTKDGLAIKSLINKGVKVAFLSNGIKRKIIQTRAELLGVNLVHVGSESKELILSSWLRELGINKEEVAYIGDDVNDLIVAKELGFFACPADAVVDVKNASDLILDKEGGKGCVREFVDNYLN